MNATTTPARAKTSARPVEVGQIWREVDKRFNRYVKVLDVRDGDIKSVLICATDSVVGRVEGRKTWASKTRFNGRRGGYELVKEQTC